MLADADEDDEQVTELNEMDDEDEDDGDEGVREMGEDERLFDMVGFGSLQLTILQLTHCLGLKLLAACMLHH